MACRFPRVLLGTLLLVTPLFAAACEREHVADSDFAARQRLRYYDNDSARETTASRKQSVGMPFGLPQGAGAGDQ